MNPNQIVDDVTGTLRAHRGPIVLWIILILFPFVVGQIIAGPGSFPYVLSLLVAVGFIYVTQHHFAKTLIGLIVLIALFFAFGFAKSTFASSVPDGDQSVETEEIIPAVEEPAASQVEEASEDTIEAPYNCTSIANFDDNIKQWCQLIDDYADDYGLDPVLVASIIQIESKGNHDAVSGMNAIGLMQVMPSDSGYPIFHQRPVSSDLFNPAINIDWGCKILAGYIETYGSIREGLLHYGPIDYGYIYADQVLALYEEKSN